MYYTKLISSILWLTVLGYCGFWFAAWDSTPVVKSPAKIAASKPISYNPATDVASGSRVKSDVKHPYYRESKSSYDLYMSSGVYIFTLNTWLNTIWNASGTSVIKVQSDWGYDLVTNGGYFTYDRPSNGFMPAGRIVDGWRAIQSMVKEFWAPDLDVNLWVTMIYNRLSNTMQVTNDNLVVPNQSIYAFHSWPQLIQNGKTISSISRNLSHWQRKAVRTFMVVDMDGKPHLWVTIQWYTLPALAAKIQEMKIFYGNYQVINLDGWSSTALAAGTRYWNTNARLPWFFGIK